MCENSKWFFDFDRDSLAKGLKLIERAIELDAANAGCHCARGFGQLYWGDIAAAAKSYHTAASLNPGDPHILAEFGLLHVYLGQLPVGGDHFERAFKLNPLSPIWFAAFVAVGDFVEGSYEKALPAFLTVPDSAWDCMYALACLGQLGELAQARSLRQRYDHRGWDLLKGAAAEPFVDPEPRQRLIRGLRKALEG